MNSTFDPKPTVPQASGHTAFGLFAGVKCNCDGNLREPIPRKTRLPENSFFTKKTGLRKSRAKKGAHGRRSEGIEAAPKILEVIFAENFARAEVTVLSIALKSNEPPHCSQSTKHASSSLSPSRSDFKISSRCIVDPSVYHGLVPEDVCTVFVYVSESGWVGAGDV